RPTPRAAAQFSLSAMLAEDGVLSVDQAVDALACRFLRVPLSPTARSALVLLLAEELGTTDLVAAQSYCEHGLRLVAHGIMCAPQYQLG
ncbi:MAG: hypothetical protein ACD_54C00254G0006, partial [uncultured bacterium]